MTNDEACRNDEDLAFELELENKQAATSARSIDRRRTHRARRREKAGEAFKVKAPREWQHIRLLINMWHEARARRLA